MHTAESPIEPPKRASSKWWLAALLLIATLLAAIDWELTKPAGREKPAGPEIPLASTSTRATLHSSPDADEVDDPSPGDPARAPESGGFDRAFCLPEAPGRGLTLSEAAATDDELGRLLSLARHYQARGERASERDALEQAYHHAPNEPYVLARHLLGHLRSPAYAKAAPVLTRYRSLVPSDEIAEVAERSLRMQIEIQDGYSRLESHGVTLDHPPELAGEVARTALAVVDQALDEAASLTGTPRRPELYVVLYRDKSELIAITCTTEWAGGLFDGRAIRTYLHSDGYPSRATLRHEVLHAQLHAAAPAAPRWLHEGLAMFFDGSKKLRELPVLEEMRKGRTYVPFSTMTQDFGDEVESAAPTYAQSFALVELLVERGGTRAIADAIALVQGGGDLSTLPDRLGLSGEVMLEFLDRRAAAAADATDAGRP